MTSSGSASSVQVSASHYRTGLYDTFERWSSYWYQLEAIRRVCPQTLLEVGVGTGLTTWYARERLGIEVTTCDFDPALKPDVVSDVRTLTEMLSGRKFEMVVAFQVLEHLPFSDFPRCLQQLRDVATRSVAISLPHGGPEFAAALRIRRKVWKVAKTFGRGQKWDLDKNGGGQHYWEIGVKGSSLRQVTRLVSDYFQIEAAYLVPENPYHYFFELSVR